MQSLHSLFSTSELVLVAFANSLYNFLTFQAERTRNRIFTTDLAHQWSSPSIVHAKGRHKDEVEEVLRVQTSSKGRNRAKWGVNGTNEDGSRGQKFA